MGRALKQIFVKPCEGCLVRKALGQSFLAAGGEYVPETTYWLRRINMRDVEISEPPKKVRTDKLAPATAAAKGTVK